MRVCKCACNSLTGENASAVAADACRCANDAWIVCVPTFQTFTMPSSPAVPRKSFPATCNVRSRRRRRYQSLEGPAAHTAVAIGNLCALWSTRVAHTCSRPRRRREDGATAISIQSSEAPALWRQPQRMRLPCGAGYSGTVSRCAMQCSPRTVRIPRPHGKIRAEAIRNSPTGAVSRCTVWDPIPNGSHGIPSGNGVQSGGSASDLGGTRADPEPVPPCCNIPLHAATYYSMLHRTRLEDLRRTAPARWQHESVQRARAR